MCLGISNNGLNPYRHYAFLFGPRLWSKYTFEIQIPLLRVALATKMTKEDNDQLRLQAFEPLDKKRLLAQ